MTAEIILLLMKSEGECDDRQTPASYKLTNPLTEVLQTEQSNASKVWLDVLVGAVEGRPAGGTKVRLVGF